jgi:hypothetical protein
MTIDMTIDIKWFEESIKTRNPMLEKRQIICFWKHRTAAHKAVKMTEYFNVHSLYISGTNAIAAIFMKNNFK